MWLGRGVGGGLWLGPWLSPTLFTCPHFSWVAAGPVWWEVEQSAWLGLQMEVSLARTLPFLSSLWLWRTCFGSAELLLAQQLQRLSSASRVSC